MVTIVTPQRRCVLFGKLLDFSQKYRYLNRYQIHNLKDNMMTLFYRIALLLLILKKKMSRDTKFLGGTGGKVGVKLEKTVILPEKLRTTVPFLPWRDGSPFYKFLT